MESRELKTFAVVLQELGLNYAETVKIVKGITKDLRRTKGLWLDGYKSKLIKLAIALITFPEPTPISESMGAAVLALGLVQNRIKKSALHIDDVYKTFQDINHNLLNIRDNVV